MICYLDTSAVVKLYIDEAHSREIAELNKKSEATASSVLAFVETHSGFSRIYREKLLTNKKFQQLKKYFSHDWQSYIQIPVSDALLKTAAQYTNQFELRAYDSIHLASANSLQQQLQLPINFLSFDKKLNKAAKLLGLETL